MRAGQLRHRITIQQDTGSEDAAGQVVESWAAWLSNEPAEVIETGGAERVFGQQVDATATHVVRIRYREGVTEQMRIVWGGRLLGISNARDRDGRRRELWISCKALKDTTTTTTTAAP